MDLAMTKEDNAGLLSKVVKFVRNPTTNWGDLDQQESSRESSYSKQMLKEMIERKRRNDFVRKREFDMLRKMRRSEAMSGNDPGARPSFFQSSMPSKPDDRAMTLKKIDEIEAQMSMQWWKTKQADSAVRPNAFNPSVIDSNLPGDSVKPTSDGPSRTAYNPTEPAPLRGSPSPATPTPARQLSPGMVLPVLPVASTRVTPPAAADSSDTANAPTEPAPLAAPPTLSQAQQVPTESNAPASDTGITSFSNSKLFAIDVGEIAHDPELEEAAIRFANGDDEGAEAGLLDVLGPKGTRINHEETWLTLFDLYRAIGKQDRYESAAIDFADRFGRSAPQWISLPEAVGRMAAPAKAASSQNPDWTCPSNVGSQTVVALNLALARATPPWRLSWAKLATVDAAALEPLTRLFTQWASQPVQLRFIGADSLERVLKNATPSGDKNVKPEWWRLRMEVLRVLHRPDEFELVALDYCVTYEVSPPSWESSRSEYKPLHADGTYEAGHTIIGDAYRDGDTSGYQDAFEGGTNSLHRVAAVELAGQIVGDATEALETLDQRLLGADLMVISCARLIRIDFSAAGSLLNWASERQSEGRLVQFTEVHRLVGAFFNVIGVSEHARVLSRKD
jgi:ABC-type transporter Mla MlaB component